ncbi:MAG TPA: NAD(P)-dependent oxidoreductase [Candidatus Saccharimonadales bacterium]|jgi:3-hydroxyisobutyrate dehydrogenase-like beta-hydroxyacid dehydrogenase|nr:NAD(P)-dependent oxidoreductase [Candidatus Saccharimonadales bacterium]
MSGATPNGETLGWIGVGRMGEVLTGRLLDRGCDLAVYNRTRAKAKPLADRGARLVDHPVELADRDIVITMVAGSSDFEAVMTGPQGLLTDPDHVPGLVVDASTVSMEVSEGIRGLAAERGVALLAAPVSGNPKAARAGMLSVAVSGPRVSYERALPYLRMLGRSVSYVGDGEAARLVKICHNLMLGVVAQILAETTVLAESGGIARADYLAFINDSVLGSTFTRYKTPAYVNLDFTPTFTNHLLRKDLELGLAAARQHDVPLPLTAVTHQIVMSLIGQGFGDQDFASLIEVAARGANLVLEPDLRFIPDGLGSNEAPGSPD